MREPPARRTDVVHRSFAAIEADIRKAKAMTSRARRPSVAEQSEFYRAEAVRMRAEAERLAEGGAFEAADLALVIAKEAERFHAQLTERMGRRYA